jgi:hypothetical protein
MKTKAVTQSEAKMVWDSIEMSSPRKVAEKFNAASQPVDFGTIAQCERDGWPGTSVADVAQPEPEKAESEKVELKKSEPKMNEPKAAPPRRRNYAQRAEDVLFKVISTSESLLDSVRDITTAVAGDGAAVAEDARPAPALKAADSIAKLMKASSEAANMAIEGLQRIPALRIDDAEAPGAPDGQGTGADEDYPLRASMEAFHQALKEIRERKS